MASSYYNSSGKEVSDGNIIYAADLNSINSAVDTGFQQVEADIIAATEDAAAYAELARKWAEEAEDVQVDTGQYSSFHWSQKSADSATASASSASASATSAAAALVSENNAADSETAAALSESNAAASEAAAALSESNAATSEANAAISEANAATSEANINAAIGVHAAEDYTDGIHGLGDASSKTVVTSTTDITADRVLTTGYLGLGGSGALQLPPGTTAERPVSPLNGMIRYNTDLQLYEGYSQSSWVPVGQGATGGVANPVFYENDIHVTESYTITTDKNAMSAGPIIVDSGVTVTVPSGSVWTIV